MSKVKIFLTKKADLQLLIIHFVHIVINFKIKLLIALHCQEKYS